MRSPVEENFPPVEFLLQRGANASYLLWAAVWRDDDLVCRALLKSEPELNLKATQGTWRDSHFLCSEAQATRYGGPVDRRRSGCVDSKFGRSRQRSDCSKTQTAGRNDRTDGVATAASATRPCLKFAGVHPAPSSRMAVLGKRHGLFKAVHSHSTFSSADVHSSANTRWPNGNLSDTTAPSTAS